MVCLQVARSPSWAASVNILICSFTSRRINTGLAFSPWVSTIGAGQYLLAPHLKEFLEKYPKLTLKLNLIDKFPDFRADAEEPVDIAYAFPQSLIPAKLPDMDLIRRKHNEVERSVYATPTYLAQHGEPKNYEDLPNHLLIFHARYQKNNIIKECEKIGISLPKILYINNTVAILNCILADMGIAIFPDFCAQKYFMNGKLVKIMPQHREPTVTTYSFYKKHLIYRQKLLGSSIFLTLNYWKDDKSVADEYERWLAELLIVTLLKPAYQRK